MCTWRKAALIGGLFVVCTSAMTAQAQTGARLAWDDPNPSSVTGYAVTIDGAWTYQWLTPLASDGTCGCSIALPFSDGRHTIVVTAYNASGETASAPLTVEPSADADGRNWGTTGDVVIRASGIPAAALHGSWRQADDSLSPDGVKLTTPAGGVAVTLAPLAAPTDYVDVTFNAAADTPYRLWLRMLALNDSKWSDSLWVQFSDAMASGRPIYRINTTSGLLVNLATSSDGSSLRDWGWQNGAYWLSQPTTFTFPTNGMHTIRIQVREDGIQLDQIVLSPDTYMNSAPGPVSGDATLVPAQ